MAAKSKFKQELKKEMDRLNDEISKSLEAGMLHGWNLVTAGTPVETGRARGSWLLSVDEMPNITLPHVGGTERVYQDPPPPFAPFKFPKDRHYFLLNNVNYIEYLEYGTPKMEAFGMLMAAKPKIDRELESAFKAIRSIK